MDEQYQHVCANCGNEIPNDRMFCTSCAGTVGKPQGVKRDQGKPRLELLPSSYWCQFSNCETAEMTCLMSSWFYRWGVSLPSVPYDPTPVLEFGAEKYDAHNWFKGLKWSRLVGAFLRHCSQYQDGLWVPRIDLQEPDEESGLPHGAHASCCRWFLREYEILALAGKEPYVSNDDRPQRGPQ